MRAVGSPRRARTVSAVPAQWSSRPAPRSRRVRSQRPRLTLRHRASSMAGSFVRGPRPLALRTSSWWTKNSLRLASLRTHPMRKNPGGGPDRSVAVSQVKSRRASAACRRWAKRLHAPGRTSPGPARLSRSRRTRCAAISRAVHGARRVGASGPSSCNRSLSRARSAASSHLPSIPPECSEAGGGLRGFRATSRFRQKMTSRPGAARRERVSGSRGWRSRTGSRRPSPTAGCRGRGCRRRP
jgi:hypothetical protein